MRVHPSSAGSHATNQETFAHLQDFISGGGDAVRCDHMGIRSFVRSFAGKAAGFVSWNHMYWVLGMKRWQAVVSQC